MAIFTIIRQPGTNGERLPAAVESAFPNANYKLAEGVWLVAAGGTAKDVSDRVGITPDAASGTGVVIEMASYYGRANPAIWSWIKESWEGQPLA